MKQLHGIQGLSIKEQAGDALRAAQIHYVQLANNVSQRFSKYKQSELQYLRPTLRHPPIQIC